MIQLYQSTLHGLFFVSFYPKIILIFEPNHSSVICRKKRQIFFWKKFGNSDHSDQPSCWLLLFVAVAVGVGTPTFAGAIIITENNLHIWSTKVHTKQQVFMEVLFVAKRSIKSAKSCGKT